MKRDSSEQKIINSAEVLFAERGFESVSLRDVTGHAGVNVASVNYYFRSKEGLINAIFARHLIPVNEARLGRLKSARDEFSPAPIPVEIILNAFFQPLVDRVTSESLNERLFAKFMGRMMSRSPEHLPPEVIASFQPMFANFVEALIESCPHLTKKELLWRLNHSFGVMVQSLLHQENFVTLCQGEVDLLDLNATVASVTQFCVAGFLSDQKQSGKKPEPIEQKHDSRQGQLF